MDLQSIMDVQLQKSLFTTSIEDELHSPAFQSDENLNKQIRLILHRPVYLLTATLISLLNTIAHLLVLIEFAKHEAFNDYFWLSLAILVLYLFSNSLSFVLWRYPNINRRRRTLCCCLLSPISIIFPYYLVCIEYNKLYEDATKSIEPNNMLQSFVSKYKRILSYAFQGYIQGIPNIILMIAALYNISIDTDLNMFYVKLCLISSILCVINSVIIIHLKSSLSKLYNIIQILCIVIDIVLICIMILYYYRCFHDYDKDKFVYDEGVCNMYYYINIISLSIALIFIIGYFLVPITNATFDLVFGIEM